MPPASREQIRARRAYTALEEHPEELADWAESLPTMLQTNGLLATWAHLLSKREASMVLQTLADHLWHWENRHGAQPTPRAVFVGWVSDDQAQLTGTRLRRLTDEALAFAVWLKRAGKASEGGE